ncbi:MAG: hypothetical protein AAGH74_11380 [Pseudomonadota bacterium]
MSDKDKTTEASATELAENDLDQAQGAGMSFLKMKPTNDVSIANPAGVVAGEFKFFRPNTGYKLNPKIASVKKLR